jgi:hypothetical protein
MHRPAVMIATLAVLGLVAAAGIGLLVNEVSGDSIGLGAEPLSAAPLAPPEASEEAVERRRDRAEEARERVRERAERRRERLQDLREQQVDPAVTDDDAFDDDEGEDNSGPGSENSGSGSDDSGSDEAEIEDD